MLSQTSWKQMDVPSGKISRIIAWQIFLGLVPYILLDMFVMCLLNILSECTKYTVM